MSRSVARWIAHHDRQQVDLAFVVDCTGSMGSYIAQVQRHITFIAERVSRTAFNVRLALVEYRDHPPQDTSFVVRSHDFTDDVNEIKVWVSEMSAAGGGDTPEAVADGLHAGLRLSYRQRATKICVWIGDAQPHGLNRTGDEIPDGCPDNHDPVAICHQMAARGIILYCVGCEPALRPFRDFFMGLSLITGGQYIRLHRANLLSQVIVLLTEEEVENENLLGHVRDHISLAFRRNPSITVDQLAEHIHGVFRLNNNRTRRIRYNNREIEGFTDQARAISHMPTLADASASIREQLEARQRQAVADEDDDVGVITSADITALDEVSPRTCERLVIRSMAQHRQETGENDGNDGDQMQQ
ncbi:uncharacterized protein LOC114515574 [Dendronephthya gigantea]|uniref:uncharacterized protein LOC114515574 n=1 Tax=Dendronephthya gigantea TaxID=151771 RepID=UPI00106C6D5B|nr:uncharacterized protein LOC114515574 [Dendronephthya gigantea]